MVCVTVHLHVPILKIRNYKKKETTNVLFLCMSKSLSRFIFTRILFQSLALHRGHLETHIIYISIEHQ